MRSSRCGCATSTSCAAASRVHRNEVRVRGKFIVGSLNSNENRTRGGCLVMTPLAATATGKCREHLLWAAPHGG